MEDFVSNIDEKIREEVKTSLIVTGGCIVSLLLNEPVNDYDIYFLDQEVLDKVKIFFIDKKEGKYKLLHNSGNALTLSDDIQIITRFVGTIEDIHSNFDFVHATNYWTYLTGMVLNQPALESILTKQLSYVGSKYPVSSIYRVRKFLERGWKINVGQLTKIMFQIAELDLKNREVLREQLVGVDMEYFVEFMEEMDKHEGNVDYTYLSEKLDEIFG